VATAEWCESCKLAIIPSVSCESIGIINYTISVTVGSFCNTAGCQASLTKGVWDIAVEVMNKCKKLQLKDQKAIGTIASKPELRQHFLAPIRSLVVLDQMFLLTRCYDGFYFIS